MSLHCLNSDTYFFAGISVIFVFLPGNTIPARFCPGIWKNLFWFGNKLGWILWFRDKVYLSHQEMATHWEMLILKAKMASPDFLFEAKKPGFSPDFAPVAC